MKTYDNLCTSAFIDLELNPIEKPNKSQQWLYQIFIISFSL